MRCRARTKEGRACTAHAGASGYCWAHDPQLGAKRAQAHREGGRVHKCPKATEGQTPVEIQSTADAIRLINAVIRDTWELGNSPARSRVLLQAAASAADLFRVGELEARILQLEQREGLREERHEQPS